MPTEGNKSEHSKPVILKKIKFLVGEEVYLKTDPKQHKRIITAVHLKPGGYEYEVRYSVYEPTLHYDIELSEERDEALYAESLIHGDGHEEDEDD